MWIEAPYGNEPKGGGGCNARAGEPPGVPKAEGDEEAWLHSGGACSLAHGRAWTCPCRRSDSRMLPLLYGGRG
jgi:hypothetical protein